MSPEEHLRGYIEWLRDMLGPLYTPPQGQGGHDLPHILRMVAMYNEIAELIPDVDAVEYEITVWLHNVDRCPYFKHAIQESNLSTVLLRILEGSRLASPIKNRMIKAIQEHGKRLDDENDSPLLQALRLADKWDRIGVIGITSGFAWLGCVRPAYDPNNPFGYGSTAEDGWKTIYQNFYRILEWYSDFPLIRELVHRHPWRFQNMLTFIRAFGEEVSAAHRLPNKVEDDLRKCLGAHYDEWAPQRVN